MALPTMPCYWTTRKNIYEKAILQRRNHEEDFRQKWTDTADYFSKNNVNASKQETWTSDRSFQNSMEAYKSNVEKETKSLNLRRRRLLLADLLEKETKVYKAELQGLSVGNFTRLEDMKDKVGGLKSAREEKRKQVAEEKLYEFWKQNNPDLRKVESDLLKEHVIDQWSDQISEHEQQLLSARKEKEEYEKMMERKRQEAMEEERKKEMKHLQDQKNLQKVLKDQIVELKQREAETEQLKKDQENLELEQWNLEKLEESRRLKEEHRKKQDFGRVLLRQHKTQLMRRSRVIQDELEQDRKLLEDLIEQEKEEELLKTSRHEKARADAQWMKQVIDDQIRVEKRREAELDMLYQEEAARVWQKREAEWEREKQARERLMGEVLAVRQDQILDKLEALRKQQEESIEQRELLVREIELANQLTRREEEAAVDLKNILKLDLREQATERREQELLSQKEQEIELQREKEEEKNYEDILREETERMRMKGHTDRGYGRKQAWM
ncbi:trichoplein keratin filament-binding protein [Patella vulgata]|uniref:trichoplein keratin filament-binding protein n=1 Tax=Patella vulgata TaxID=6465 RepID=UPI00217F85CE|nr:trichoplein keratin filament-binding protein [Patella vulgata]